MEKKWVINKRKVNYLLWALCIVFVISVFVRWHVWGLDSNFYESISGDIIIGVLELIFTYFVIDKAIQKSTERQENLNNKRTIKILLKNQYVSMLSALAPLYSFNIFKNTELSPSKKDLSNLVEDRYRHLQEALNHMEEMDFQDFFSQEFSIPTSPNMSTFEMNFQTMPAEQYFEHGFKAGSKQVIGEFIHLYASILPTEIVMKLGELMDTLNSNVFTTLAAFNLQPPPNTKSHVNSNAFKDELRKYGEALLFLFEYYLN